MARGSVDDETEVAPHVVAQAGDSMPMTTRRFPALAALAFLSAVPGHAAAQTPPRRAPLTLSPPADAPFKVEVVADFDSPWAMTFLPDGRMLITEEAGTMFLVSADGKQRKAVDRYSGGGDRGPGRADGRRAPSQVRAEQVGLLQLLGDRRGRQGRGPRARHAHRRRRAVAAEGGDAVPRPRRTSTATVTSPAASPSPGTVTCSSPTASGRSSTRRRIRRRRSARCCA